jgi:hypothetical protein
VTSDERQDKSNYLVARHLSLVAVFDTIPSFPGNESYSPRSLNG